jgi:hypothetical protein
MKAFSLVCAFLACLWLRAEEASDTIFDWHNRQVIIEQAGMNPRTIKIPPEMCNCSGGDREKVVSIMKTGSITFPEASSFTFKGFFPALFVFSGKWNFRYDYDGSEIRRNKEDYQFMSIDWTSTSLLDVPLLLFLCLSVARLLPRHNLVSVSATKLLALLGLVSLWTLCGWNVDHWFDKQDQMIVAIVAIHGTIAASFITMMAVSKPNRSLYMACGGSCAVSFLVSAMIAESEGNVLPILSFPAVFVLAMVVTKHIASRKSIVVIS